MPTVLRIKGLRVVIFPNDHRPAHVHIDGGHRAAAFVLNCPDGPAELRENYGFRQRELTEIAGARSEEHTSELQSLMRISYAVFCLKKKKKPQQTHTHQ